MQKAISNLYIRKESYFLLRTKKCVEYFHKLFFLVGKSLFLLTSGAESSRVFLT